MATLAESGELIIAESEQVIVGAVAYIGPGKPKNSFFETEWSIMRMLVVSPVARGFGIGHRLAEECLNRARRDGGAVFALHTTRIMKIALAMYERMGFKLLRDAPPIFGVPYCVYIKLVSISSGLARNRQLASCAPLGHCCAAYSE